MVIKELESLFEPIRIGDMELKNRIVMAPMGVGFASSDGFVTQRTIDYYAARAKGGVGLITVEAACVDTPVGIMIPRMLYVDDDKYIPELKRLTDTIHAGGAKASLDLAHGGRYSRSKSTGVTPVAPSPIASRYTGETPRELTTEETEAIIEKFSEAARRAQEAGFDAVELMGCTGYLISQFVSSLTNKRTDRFGGDAAARATFLIEIIQGIRKKLGKDFPISCKLSVDEYLPGGNTIEDSRIIARKAEEAGTSIVHAWAGWHESPIAMLPMSVERGAFVPLAQAMKEVVDVPVIAVGRINDPRLAAEIIRSKKADLIAMGRPLLADPELPRKAAEGRLEDIRTCIACCRCFDALMGAIQQAGTHAVVCSLNAELGREGEGRVKPATKPKNVLIVGGGAAGMEAARIVATRGHRVTLWEEKDELGGNLILATLAPHKEEIKNLIAYLTHQMQGLGVRVELSKKVTPEAILRENADEVIIATGALPIIPEIAGVERENVVTATDVLTNRKSVGKRVVVVGGGMIGCETAEFLADKGKKVTIVEMLERIARDIGPTTRWVTVKRLRDIGIEMLTSTRVKAITEGGVMVEKDGDTRTLEADSIVLAVGLKPDRKLLESLEGLLPKLEAIGDCAQVNKILEAIHHGWRIGCEI